MIPHWISTSRAERAQEAARRRRATEGTTLMNNPDRGRHLAGAGRGFPAENAGRDLGSRQNQ